jgi:hypothetical protein
MTMKTHIEAKVIATTRKTTPKKKKQATHDDAHTRESSNVGVKEVPLLGGKQTSTTQKGVDPQPVLKVA